MKDIYVQERERSRIPEKYTWDLTDVYPSDEAWTDAKRQLEAEMAKVKGFREKLKEAPGQLLDCLELINRLWKECTRLSCYAGMKSDIDTRDAKYAAMDQEIGQLGSDLSSISSFIEPEILEIGSDAIDLFIAREPRLAVYRHIFDNILRKKAHTKTEAEEKIIAEANLMADSPQSIYSLFSNADFPFPEITLENNVAVRLDHSAFDLHRRSAIRENRKKVLSAYLGKMHDFSRTFGAQLYAEVRKNMFFTRARSYNSCLERSLNAQNIPVAVYKNLIAGVHAHLGTLHRYLNLRKNLLGLDELHYYDLLAPAVKKADVNYTYEEAVECVLASLTPLGSAYQDAAQTALANRWIDVYHNDGKRSGAYSNGSVYDAHPYILLNYNGAYDDVSTLTHELGHTMHSCMSNKAQHFALSHYSIFVAEVASTFNEALLLDHMQKIETTDEVRLSLLVNYLDNARATMFRQTQFAEFELKIHETAEQGVALTGESISALYSGIVREYYGHDKKICIVDDEVQSEWTYIPHFFYNFYVYQYATSFAASAALSKKVLAGDEETKARYLELLSSGGSDYPIELLKKAGVDLTEPQPLEAVMLHMDEVMDEIEKIAQRLGFIR